MVPEKYILLDNTNDFSGIVAFSRKNCFHLGKKYSCYWEDATFRDYLGWVWEGATCKFVSLSFQNRDHS